MRLLLLLAVVALGADALLYSGAYTQAAWREASFYAGRLVDAVETKTSQTGQPG
jgi:hypothetical protein